MTDDPDRRLDAALPRLSRAEDEVARLAVRVAALEDQMRQHSLRLVAIAGEDGRNGRLGDTRDDVAKLDGRVNENAREIVGLKIKIAVFSALGASLGGALIEAIKFFAGGR